jgi:hypothetical protein
MPFWLIVTFFLPPFSKLLQKRVLFWLNYTVFILLFLCCFLLEWNLVFLLESVGFSMFRQAVQTGWEKALRTLLNAELLVVSPCFGPGTARYLKLCLWSTDWILEHIPCPLLITAKDQPGRHVLSSQAPCRRHAIADVPHCCLIILWAIFEKRKKTS